MMKPDRTVSLLRTVPRNRLALIFFTLNGGRLERPATTAPPAVVRPTRTLAVSTAKSYGIYAAVPLIKLLVPVQYLAMNSSSTGGTPGVVSVVGATGRQGSAVVRHLLQDGWQVRALTRNPSSKASVALGQMGAEVHRVDTEDAATLASAFRATDGVFNVQNPMTSSAEAEVRQGLNVASAAAEAGVKHVVYGAAGVGDYKTGVGSWDSKLVVAQRFRELGLPLTVLRPMAFMELMTDKGYYPQLSTWHLMPKLMGPSRPVGWLCLDDLGAIAARVFAEPETWRGRVLSLASDVQSIDQCRALWVEGTGHRPRGFPMPVRLFERFVGTDLTTMWRWLRTNQFDMSTQSTREILPDALTVRQWMDRAAAPRKQ